MRLCVIKAIAWSMVAFLSAIAPAGAVTKVPPGNVNAEQPPIPGASQRRTKALKTTFDAKYAKVYALLKGDKKLRAAIRKVAGQFGIDPVHIAGAIVGEHTYNVDVYDRLQTYYVKAIAWVKEDVRFEHGGESVDDFIRRPQFSKCDESAGSYAVWTCRENIWNKAFRGKTVDGAAFPNDRFSAVFFQPFYAGQTFGIGQVNPLTALKLSDTVNRVTGLPKLSHTNGKRLYETIMNPDKTLPYVAASLKTSIDAYRRIADFDISGNHRNIVQHRRGGTARRGARRQEPQARRSRPTTAAA